ncbi:MAG TPA: tetratricopeptide repeat protein, partial [Polyangiaceae bacterium]|nr:tetratricopeptide repeat protein [Polyangiaceae bacterium]
LGDTAGARSIYELVLSEDPGHEKAASALCHILEKSSDFAVLVKLLESQLDSQPADVALRTSCRIGEIYDDLLGNSAEAIRIYKRALEQDGQSLDALRGLERAYMKQGKYQEVLENLETQVSLSATPKQRIALLERIASIYEEEFLNHDAAAKALQRALDADAGRVSAMSDLIRHLRILDRWEEASSLYERQLALVQERSERISLGLAWGRLLADQVGSPERAVRAYELVIAEDPEHAVALEALARLREAVGDADQALHAIITLAEQAEAPAARSEQYLRAARLQESRGNRDSAIEYYKHALDSQPDNRAIAASLREAYVKRGDISAAVELLEREIDITEGDLAQARLTGEMARLQREGLKDRNRAEATAKRALALDPGNAEALLVLGDIAFDSQRFVEASASYGRLAERTEALGQERAVQMLIRYVDALTRSGSTENALVAMDSLLRLAPADPEAYGRVTQVVFEHGAPGRAVSLLSDYLAKFSDQLSDRERALGNYRLGESLRKTGEVERAIKTLNDAVELDPAAEAPLEALALAYQERELFADAVRIKSELLDLVSGERRVDL